MEAAQRSTTRLVAVKSEEAQARAMLFRTRELLVHQRTETINALARPSGVVRSGGASIWRTRTPRIAATAPSLAGGRR